MPAASTDINLRLVTQLFRSVVILVVVVLVFAYPAGADQPEFNRAHDTESSNGRFVIKMRPAKSFGPEGTGIAFETGEQGETRLWEVDWFANKAEISDDGEYLVRYGPWGTDHERYSDLGIAFYHRGRLLREYRVNELVKDQKAIVHSTSHYWWQPERQAIPTGFHGDDRYRIVVADKTVYEFALATGEIVARDVDPQARNWYEVHAEEEEAAQQRGKQALAASGIDRIFRAHFTFDEVGASGGKTMGVHFEEAEWRANLTPVRMLGRPCMVEAVFPLFAGDRIESSLKPQEILAAFEKALAHPYVAKRCERGAASLRMRITGDRLHWDTPELRELLKKLDHADTEQVDLRQWAYFIIDAQEPRFTSFYLNVETGALIYEDPATWPREPVLLDATGN